MQRANGKAGQSVFCDWEGNRKELRIALLLVLFRIAQSLRARRSALSPLASLVYRTLALFFYSIDIPTSTSVGPRLTIHHGFGLVVNASAVLGSDVTLRHGVTIGSRRTSSDAPIVADKASFGPSAVALGSIEIGRGATIGAGTVVTVDVPAGAVVVAREPRVIGD